MSNDDRKLMEDIVKKYGNEGEYKMFADVVNDKRRYFNDLRSAERYAIDYVKRNESVLVHIEQSFREFVFNPYAYTEAPRIIRSLSYGDGTISVTHTPTSLINEITEREMVEGAISNHIHLGDAKELSMVDAAFKAVRTMQDIYAKIGGHTYEFSAIAFQLF